MRVSLLIIFSLTFSGFAHSASQVSHIAVKPSGDYELQFANGAQAAELAGCPLNETPQSILDTMAHLSKLLETGLAQLQQTDKRLACTALINGLKTNRDQLGNLINPTISSHLTTDSATTPDELKKIQEAEEQRIANQRAAAITQVVSLGTELLDSECIASQDTRLLVQQLIGQAITLGGIAFGGWGGVAAASGGVIFSKIPFFRPDIIKATDAFKDFQNSTGMSSFLCLYREIQRGTSLLFLPPDSEVVAGYDLSRRTGMTLEASEAVALLKKEDSRLYEETVFADLIAVEGTKLTSLEALFGVCRKVLAGQRRDLFSNLSLHPVELRELFEELFDFCDGIGRRQLPPEPVREALLKGIAAKVKVVNAYQQSGFRHPKVEAAMATYLKWKFVEQTTETYRGTLKQEQGGNQLRIHLLNLTERVGETLAYDSFKRLAQDNISRARKTKDVHVRQRAVLALLDLCRTFDPTLAPLYVGAAEEPKLLKLWEKTCVSSEAALCKLRIGKTVERLPSYETYYRSLCFVTPPPIEACGEGI